MKRLEIADLFCGAGGTSTGAVEAARAIGFQPMLTAVNHWEVAIDTHQTNHPEARHFCTGIDDINPRKLWMPGELDVLWASPECTHHSVARGGAPINDQSRATAWCVTRWADAVLPPVILVENVPEFVTWGPLVKTKNGWRPDPKRKGEIFRAWVGTLNALGYKVEHRMLCAADYGDPTTRKRLFVCAVRGRRKIVWPNPTHGENRKPYATARDEVIDWSLSGRSIFDRKKPLVVKTIRRVLAGFERFALQPFLHEHQGTDEGQIESSAKQVEKPLSAVATSGGHHALATAYVLPNEGVHRGNAPRSVAAPLNGAGALAVTFLVPNFGERDGQTPRMHSVDKPMPAVTGHGAGALVSALLGQQSGASPRSSEEPAPTVATQGAIGKIDYIIAIDHQSSGDGNAVHSVEEPLSTATTKARHSVLTSFLVSYYGNGTASPVSLPTPTVTTKDRFSLVRPRLQIVTDGNESFRCVSYAAWKRLLLCQARKRKRLTRLYLLSEGNIYQVEITHRMLQVRELAAAQGFQGDYVFKGTKTEQVRQIGNAVPRRLARALVCAALTQNPDVSWLDDSTPAPCHQ